MFLIRVILFCFGSIHVCCAALRPHLGRDISINTQHLQYLFYWCFCVKLLELCLCRCVWEGLCRSRRLADGSARRLDGRSAILLCPRLQSSSQRSRQTQGGASESFWEGRSKGPQINENIYPFLKRGVCYLVNVHLWKRLTFGTVRSHCNTGSQHSPSNRGDELKVHKKVASAPLLLRRLSGGGAWPCHQLSSLHPKCSDDDGWEVSCD